MNAADTISMVTGIISLVQLGILCAIYERLGNYGARITTLERRLKSGIITTT